MRISTQPIESSIKAQVSTPIQATITDTGTAGVKKRKVQEVDAVKTESKVKSEGEESKTEIEKVQEAVRTLNDFLKINNYSSKFVLHEGLDEYFVQLVDPQTEEVIKEIPPKNLLDSFYEMQKLAGVIVDERI
ncbi:flagellar biosynthesis protein FlaG [Lysinibacillus fusiformis]|nr:flagellar biosynthesis protein FlaG [Lysinibacillus fusiformis]